MEIIYNFHVTRFRNSYGAGSLVRRIAYDRATGQGVEIFFSIFFLNLVKLSVKTWKIA